MGKALLSRRYFLFCVYCFFGYCTETRSPNGPEPDQVLFDFNHLWISPAWFTALAATPCILFNYNSAFQPRYGSLNAPIFQMKRPILVRVGWKWPRWFKKVTEFELELKTRNYNLCQKTNLAQNFR